MIGSIEVVNPITLWNDLILTDVAAPDVATWFAEEDPVQIPDRTLGWHFAQGWVPDGDPVRDPDHPAAWLHPLKRNSLQNQVVLTKLIEQYTTAHNDGRTANDTRFDNLVAMYNDTLLKTQSHLNRAAARHNEFEVLYLTSLDSVVSVIDFYLNTTRSDASATFDEAAAALNAFSAKLDELGTGYGEYVTDLQAILTKQQADLSTFEANTTTLLTQLTSDFSTHQTAIGDLEATEDSEAAAHIAAYEIKLAELETTVTTAETDLLALVTDAENAFTGYQTAALAIVTAITGEYASLDSTITGLMTSLDTAVGSHQTTHAGLVALFLSDFTTHAATARALLTGLGTTELARINETFDNLLAANLQKLTDRGFYSSNQITQVTTRNERERTEAIGALNDRLAREKVSHEHALYGEQTEVRQRQVIGEQYTFKLTEMAIEFRAKWGERLYGLAVEAQKIYLGIRNGLHEAANHFIDRESAVRERIAGWRLDTKKAVADGQSRVYQIRDAINRWKTDSEFKQADALRAIRAARLDVFSKTLAASLDVEKFAATARESIVGKLNEYIAQHAAGVARYAEATIRNGQFLAGVRSQTVADAIRTRFEFCNGLEQADATQQKLLGYQLDARNNLAVAMFGFMERRTDSYPDIGAMGQIAMGLGDAGATQWVET